MKIINSVDDLVGLKRNEQIQYTCKNCGKLVVRQYRTNRINIIKRFLCAQCNLKQSMIDKYGAATTLQSPELRAKVAATKKKLYGNEHYVNLEKAQRTMRDRYGVESYTVASDFQEKSKATMNARYGVDYAAQNKDIYAKVRATNKAKYGKESYTSTEEFKEKSKQTNLAKRGVEHVTQSEEFKEKVRQTNNAKYGCDNPFGNKEIQERIKQTNLALYGVDNVFKHPDVIKRNQQLRGRRYSYGDEKFDSSWEMALWIYAKDHNESIERVAEPLTYVVNGKTHYYFPDFKYKGELVEVKGSQFMNNGIMINPFDHSENDRFRAKQLCALENGVKFMYHEDIQFAIDYAIQKFNNDKHWYNNIPSNMQMAPLQLTPLLPLMPMYIYPTIPMMLPWWIFMTPCDFTPFSTNVFEREGMEFVDCECEYE